MPFLQVYHTPPDCLICQMIKCTLQHFASAASAMQIHFRKCGPHRNIPVGQTRPSAMNETNQNEASSLNSSRDCVEIQEVATGD